jgi:RHS repeat-associated protein
MEMPGRKYNPQGYRYGFNGQEKSPEIGEGHTTAEFWAYDTRLGFRWNTDPVVVPSLSPYACFNGNPILFTDPSGATVTFENTSSRNMYLQNKEHTSQLLRERGAELRRQGGSFLTDAVYTNLTGILNEYATLESSKQHYHVADKSKEGGEFIRYRCGVAVHGLTLEGIPFVKVPETGVIDVIANTLTGLCHELTHAYQFEMRKVGFQFLKQFNIYEIKAHDAVDEQEAFQREEDLYNTFSEGRWQGQIDITPTWVQDWHVRYQNLLTTPISMSDIEHFEKIHKNINRGTNLSFPNIPYKSMLKMPLLIYGGWEKYK